MPERARDNPMHRLPDWRHTLPLAQSCHRCGARTRSGASCKSPAMQNGRCRMHGGTSTGPRTSEGLERMRRANTRHGIYSEESRRQMRAIRKLVREAEQTGRFVEQADELKFYKKLATMDATAPLPSLDDQVSTWANAAVLARQWELGRLADRLDELATSRAVRT